MRIKKARFGGVLFCVFAMCFYMMSGLLTAAADDIAETGSITLICKSGDTVLPDMDWSIYRLGAHLSSDEFVLQGDFADYPVSLEDTSASALQDAADTLENYALVDAISPLAVSKTDSDGSVTFSDLERGLYLVSGGELVIGKTRYIPSAAIIEVTENDDSLLDWTVYPKFTEKDASDQISSEYSVEKIWQGDDGANVRPTSITVDIYADGELSDTVTLSQSNNWKYKWVDETSKIKWSVKEREVPNGYTVVYREDSAQFAIVNTYKTSTTTSTPTSSTTDTKIPQTGQLWWPVPVLSLAGIVLIAIGWRFRTKKESDE